MPRGPCGREAGATCEQMLELAMRRYLRGARVDVTALAAELGLGRATIHRWFASRDDLIGEVLAGSAHRERNAGPRTIPGRERPPEAGPCR
jgi:AcrR family transcriptional regulator